MIMYIPPQKGTIFKGSFPSLVTLFFDPVSYCKGFHRLNLPVNHPIIRMKAKANRENLGGVKTKLPREIHLGSLGIKVQTLS